MSKLVQRQEQKQKLNPKQILEANIMQLNSGILEKRIFEEIENNPILEFDEDNVDAESVEDNEENDFDWEELISNPEEYTTFVISPRTPIGDNFIISLVIFIITYLVHEND